MTFIFVTGYTLRERRSHSSIWLERRPVTAKVAGSSPVGSALETLFERSEN